jgi:hypothetical protein
MPPEGDYALLEELSLNQSFVKPSGTYSRFISIRLYERFEELKRTFPIK